MKKVLHRANGRGFANHGWLVANHSFSFASYYHPDKVHFGALRVLNDDSIAGGMGFARHPHENMEIVTIPLEGALKHQDSMGHISVLKPNDVQVMSAGVGIYHSEHNALRDQTLKLFQIWVFPKELNIEPRYKEHTFEVVNNEWQILVSPENEDSSPLWIHQDAWFCRAKLDANQSITYNLHQENQGVYLMVVEGEIEIAGEKLQKRDAIGIWETSQIALIAQSQADVLLIEVPMVF